jgi:signal recognition particle receptor subunit beta
MVIGDKGVGKTTFLDTVSKNFGKIIESQISDELNITTVALMDDNTMYKI